MIFFFCLFLQRFLQHFTDPNSREDENAGLDLNEPLYMQKLDEVRSAVLIRKAQGSEVVHVWSCKIRNIQFLCNNVFFVCVLRSVLLESRC